MTNQSGPLMALQSLTVCTKGVLFFFTLCFAPAGRCLNSFQFHSQQPISWKSFLENSQNPLITTLIITSGKDEKYFSMFFFFMINIFVSQFNYGDSPSTASLQPPDGHSSSCLCILLPSSQTLLSFFKVVLINRSLIVFTVLCCTLDVFSFTFTSVLVTDRYWRNVFFICLLKT